MSPEQLSASELIEEARKIHTAADTDGRAVFDAREGEILHLAAAIEESRRRTGIAGVVDNLLGGIIGEKRRTEARLAELRTREAKVEKLLAERSGIEDRLKKAKVLEARIKGLEAGYRAASTPEGIKAIFKKRTWAIGEHNFEAHITQAAAEAAAAKILGENFSVFMDAASAEVASIKSRIAEIERDLKGLTK